MDKRLIYYTAGGLLVAAAAVAGATAMQPPRRVLREAGRWVGVREVGNNQGFDNPAFEKGMRAIGFWTGAPWCAFFVRFVMLSVCGKGSKGYAFWSASISPSTHVTWANLQKKSDYHEVISKPEAGAMVIYQGISDPASGHIELIEKVNKNSYTVITGNSGFTDGSGQGVVRKDRPMSGMPGAKILGFIKIRKV